jgi:hypothetical protein
VIESFTSLFVKAIYDGGAFALVVFVFFGLLGGVIELLRRAMGGRF